MAGIIQKQVVRDEKVMFLQSFQLTFCGRDVSCSSLNARLDAKKDDSLLIRNFLLNNKSASWLLCSRLNETNGGTQFPSSKWLNMLSPRVILNTPAKENVSSFNCRKSDIDRLLSLTVSMSKLTNELMNNFSSDKKLVETSEKPAETDLRYISCVDLCSDLGQKLQNRELKRRRRLPLHVDHTYADRRPTWYDDYCNKPSLLGLEDPFQRMGTRRSAAAEYTMAFNFNRRMENVHEYHYTKRQRKEFCRRFDTGLSASSRRIKRQMKPCVVRLHRLSSDSISVWTRAEICQRDESAQTHYEVELLPCFVVVNPLGPALPSSKTCLPCSEYSDTVISKTINSDETVAHLNLFGSNHAVRTSAENYLAGNKQELCRVDQSCCAKGVAKRVTGRKSTESATVTLQKNDGLKVCTVSLNKVEQTRPSVDNNLSRPPSSSESFNRKRQTVSCSIRLNRLASSEESYNERRSDDTDLKTRTTSTSLPLNSYCQVNPVVQLRHCDFSQLSFKSQLNDRLDDTAYSLPLTPLSCTDWQTV
jgi:hypothetical protein